MARSSDSIILGISLVFCMLMLGAFSGPADSSSRLQARAGAANQDCTTLLASDLYGLGVRLGVYFQWLSAWISNTFVPDLISDGLDANAMYLAAILLSIIHSSLSAQMTLMDGLIQIWLCAGTVGSVLSLWGYRTALYRAKGKTAISEFGGFGTHFRLILASATALYAIWYWSYATGRSNDDMPAFGVPGTGADNINVNCVKTSVTIYGVDIRGDARYFGLAVSGIVSLYCSLLLLASPVALITRIRKMILLWKAKDFASSSRLRFMPAAKNSELKFISYALGALTLIWMLFSAISIELILNENCAWKVLGAQPAGGNSNILTPGQFLPMLIGAFSFVKLLYFIFQNWRHKDGALSPSLGREPSRYRGRNRPNPQSRRSIFKFFLPSSVEKAETYSKYNNNFAQEERGDTYPFRHMNFFLRMLVTLVPHVSLFWSWPWSSAATSMIAAEDNEDSQQLRPISQNSEEHLAAAGKDRTVTWSREVEVEEHELYDRPIHEA